MVNFETQIQDSQREMAAAQAKISEVTARIEQGRAKLAAGEDAINLENATLQDVNKQTDLMNANIAELIMGLDDVTAGFSKDFDEMRTKTGMESFIGMFSSAKSESMRQERLRTASIDDKLQDLIAKSDVIVRLLQGQLHLLNVQKGRVEANLGDTLTEREAAVTGLDQVRAEIAAMDPKIIELENKISVEQDASTRTALESDLAGLNARFNALVQDEQVQLAKSQTLERISKKGKLGSTA
jgi:chromosome segregation ATPase